MFGRATRSLFGKGCSGRTVTMPSFQVVNGCCVALGFSLASRWSLNECANVVHRRGHNDRRHRRFVALVWLWCSLHPIQAASFRFRAIPYPAVRLGCAGGPPALATVQVNAQAWILPGVFPSVFCLKVFSLCSQPRQFPCGLFSLLRAGRRMHPQHASRGVMICWCKLEPIRCLSKPAIFLF